MSNRLLRKHKPTYCTLNRYCLHFTGNSPHSDGDVVFSRSVQVFSLDGDHGSSGRRTLRWVDGDWFGVLDGEDNK